MCFTNLRSQSVPLSPLLPRLLLQLGFQDLASPDITQDFTEPCRGGQSPSCFQSTGSREVRRPFPPAAGPVLAASQVQSEMQQLRRPWVLAAHPFCHLPDLCHLFSEIGGISLAMPQCLLWICLAVWEARGDLPFIAENDAVLMVNW